MRRFAISLDRVLRVVTQADGPVVSERFWHFFLGDEDDLRTGEGIREDKTCKSQVSRLQQVALDNIPVFGEESVGEAVGSWRTSDFKAGEHPANLLEGGWAVSNLLSSAVTSAGMMSRKESSLVGLEL